MARPTTDPKERHYPESRFGGFTDADQVVLFYTRVRSLICAGSVVLDIGCGRGKNSDEPVPTRRRVRRLDDLGATVIGIDVDPSAAANPYLDSFHLLRPDRSWPLPDASVDVAIGDYVLEHVDDPQQFFDECRRVLRPGGYLCLRTTNAHSYFGLAARVVPNAGHGALVQRLYRSPRLAADVFPVRYRCNTVPRLRRALAGFDHCVYGHQADPAHFGFSPLLYRAGVAHQRFAPARWKPTLFVFAQRQPG